MTDGLTTGEVIALVVSAVAVFAGLLVIWQGTREDKQEDRWVEFLHHPYIGSGHQPGCIVWSTDNTEQCGLMPEDHAYNREDSRHEW